MRHIVLPLILSLLTALLPAAATAHEFWIEPVEARIPSGGTVVARTMIGARFPGEELENSASLRRAADLTLGDRRVAFQGPEGQLPALQAAALGDGLHILRIESQIFQVNYKTYDDFLNFLAEAQRTDLIAEHDARGLSRDAIREAYFRFAKSLVAVGEGEGADINFGMPYELVALTNPYTAAKGDPVRYQLLFLGEPEPHAPVNIAHRLPDGLVIRTQTRSDPGGIIVVPDEGAGFYLVNAIKIQPASARMQTVLGAVWQSLWASSTYARD